MKGDKKLNKIFDLKYAKSFGQGRNLSVTLRKNFKGISMYATKDIRKNAIVAYYKFLVKKYDEDKDGVKNNMYTIIVYTKKDRESSKFIGDVYEGSLREPRFNIPFWGYFSNEPATKQKNNAFLDINLKENYKNRTRVKEGDTMIYKIRALKNIKKGEEITWCYGDGYVRDYPTSCS